MKNYVQKGDALTFTAPSGGVSSGDVVKIGALIGVAVLNGAEGEKFQDTMNKVTRRQLRTVDTLYGSEDNLEGFRAFSEKRDPVWKGK